MAQAHNVKITSIDPMTHDVLRIRAEKPQGLEFHSGQAVDVSINQPKWKNEIRPFTFTSLPSDDFIEFHIKTYTDHDGVTNHLRTLKPGDELIIGEVFGDTEYKGEGVFIAGGSGITPFISILKKMEKEGNFKNSVLLYANKKAEDIILKEKFEKMFGDRFINILSDEEVPGYEHGFVNAELIKKYANDSRPYFYLCGPPPMMNVVNQHFKTLGINEQFIIQEPF